ncbi:hypothetical protein ACZ11_05835 [Lysinibacillus xylanilyticus]|uniref:Uncharacterized protein n=1 Tax=Lysinibacillus xylanilyticus TaxID=582475 RepID=A0A0K9FBV7_9BACI|nr:hypothetical protein [Lysinibacillus xylanilyticus]KMY31722.1 hypothetical protein ACZ11_05835 [Lysinibacillus xylanilyticus]
MKTSQIDFIKTASGFNYYCGHFSTDTQFADSLKYRVLDHEIQDGLTKNGLSYEGSQLRIHSRKLKIDAHIFVVMFNKALAMVGVFY